jgi:hypothetical protein
VRRLLFAAVVVAGCAVKSHAQTKDLVFRGTEEEARGLYTDVAIFGRDDRVEALDAEEPWRSLARSAPMIADSWRVSTFGGYANMSGVRYGEAEELSPRTRFYGQPKVGVCSAGLIAPDLVLTAGHCVSTANCRSKVFVFDFFHDPSTGLHPRVPETSVARCAGVVAGGPETQDENGVHTDWVVVRLDRAMTGRPLLEVVSDAPARGDRLVMIGYPAGMPAKTAFGRARETRNGLLWADLDELKGNSGSPVFDAAGRVIGVLARAPEDYAWRYPTRRSGSVLRGPRERGLRRYPEGWGTGAGIMPSARFAAELAPLLTATGRAGP